MNKTLEIFKILVLRFVRKRFPFVNDINFYDGYRGFEVTVSISKLKEHYGLKYESWFKDLYEENPEEALKTISYSPIIEIPFKMEGDDDILDLGDLIADDIKRLLYKTAAVPTELQMNFRKTYGTFGITAGSYVFEP